jgi:hypothetical protein
MKRPDVSSQRSVPRGVPGKRYESWVEPFRRGYGPVRREMLEKRAVK